MSDSDISSFSDSEDEIVDLSSIKYKPKKVAPIKPAAKKMSRLLPNQMKR